MRLSKFLFIMVIITIVSVVYVQQQISLLKVSYEIKDKEKTLQELLDKNKISMYNVFVLKAPASLEKRLMVKNVRLEMPQEWQLLSLPEVEVREGLVLGEPKLKNVLLGIFNLKVFQAEAELVNKR